MAGFLTPSGKTDYLSLLDAHRLMTRFLIRATFSEVGDPKSREVLDRNRRIGVGHFGVASFLALIGKKYSKAPADKHFKNLLRELAREVDRSAEEFCHDLRIPVPVKKRTIAPTGTIAKMPGVSEGVHPIFAKYFIRRVRLSKVDPDQVSMAEKYAVEGFLVEDDMYADNTSVVSIPTKDSLVEAVVDRFGRDGEEIVEAADDLSLKEMLAFQALYQTHWADNAVSFTANVDPAQYKGQEVEQEIVRFAGKLKGATIFPEASMPQAPYERLTKEEYEAAQAKQIADGVDEECGTGGCPVR
jgi:adenosylcobalamin-dependent ribonucleoside-triphosphate reductase